MLYFLLHNITTGRPTKKAIDCHSSHISNCNAMREQKQSRSWEKGHKAIYRKRSASSVYFGIVLWMMVAFSVVDMVYWCGGGWPGKLTWWWSLEWRWSRSRPFLCTSGLILIRKCHLSIWSSRLNLLRFLFSRIVLIFTKQSILPSMNSLLWLNDIGQKYGEFRNKLVGHFLK